VNSLVLEDGDVGATGLKLYRATRTDDGSEQLTRESIYILPPGTLDI
jgi:hypothetical protein